MKAILIQARMGSERLPGKSMLNLNNELKVIDAVYHRCKQSKCAEEVIVCIPNTEIDRVLEDHLTHKKIKFFKGHPTDLVERFSEAAHFHKIEQFIRVTGDSPLVDPEVIDYFFKIDRNKSFIDGFFSKRLPDGTVISRLDSKILFSIDQKESDVFNREHVVTSKFLNKYRYVPEIPKKWNNPQIRYCLDTEEDYELLTKLFSVNEILNYKTEDIISLVIKYSKGI